MNLITQFHSQPFDSDMLEKEIKSIQGDIVLLIQEFIRRVKIIYYKYRIPALLSLLLLILIMKLPQKSHRHKSI